MSKLTITTKKGVFLMSTLVMSTKSFKIWRLRSGVLQAEDRDTGSFYPVETQNDRGEYVIKMNR